MERLNQLHEYLAEAEKDPENNVLYIEDLKVSIRYQQSLLGALQDKALLHRIN